ncbi:unnamed protein product [Cuscuta epithymum]|uniref:Uncharacterized protein n=1 Tax=Cuscuta epithymum TaxID=186058 RepID=A0AAV0FBH1_9ASTE|nr:unnamed protein product [Cuscuta epithymum]
MIITIFMHHDRPLSAIVSRFTVRIAHFPPGWRRPSYAVRSAPQRHRTQLTFSSSIPSRVATNVLCITIGPSAPSCPDSRFGSLISLQDGDDRLMQYDRPLSAIVPSSRSARPSLPGWRRTSYASRSAPQRHRVLIHGSDRPFPPGWRRPSYAVRSAPQRHHTQLTFSSSIPSRVATNVLCITIGPSAPSCPDSRFGSPIPSRMATTVLCSTIGPSAPSCPDSRFGSPIPSRMATTVLCSTIGPSAPSYPAHVRIAHSFQGGDERLMQHDQRLCAIVSGSCSARPSLPGWRRTSLMQHVCLSALTCPGNR